MENVEKLMRSDNFCNYCNIELLSVSEGHATAKMTLHPHHLNGLHIVQGGAIFTLADFTFAAAANSYGFASVAIHDSITYMKAATTGTLWAEATEISKNFKIGTYSVQIKDDAGDLIAQFQGLAYRKKDKIPES